jgi:hypothetical protein
MKRMILAAAAVAAALLAITAGTARAAPADHSSFSFSGTTLNPAGTVCDFNEQETFAVKGSATIAPNGQIIENFDASFTHTNLDTGYSLSEVDHFTGTTQLVRGTIINVGIFFHLRDASDNNVLVKAGELTFDATTGETLMFTPNSGFDQTTAQILCTALGGSPA